MERDRVYLRHMRDAIAKIERYLAGTDYETVAGNDMMIDAVIRELEIIGEAASDFRGRHTYFAVRRDAARIEPQRIARIEHSCQFSVVGSRFGIC